MIPLNTTKARLQVLSVLWVIGFIALRMWQVAGGNHGPSEFVSRALVTTPAGVMGMWTIGLVMPLVIWFACRRPPPNRDDRVLNTALGLLAMAFLALHASHSAWPRALGWLDPLGAYQRMLRELGTPLFVVTYALGLPAVGFVVHRLVTSLFDEESRGDLFGLVVAVAILGFGLYAISGMMTGTPLLKL